MEIEGTMLCSANYVALSPISFLERAGIVYGERHSIVYGDRVKYTWKQTLHRCIQLASSIVQLGVRPGDLVAALAPNVPALYELHFAAPMSGALICSLNTSYDSEMLSVLLKELEPKILFVDYEFLNVAKEALDIISNTSTATKLPLIAMILDQYQHQQEQVSSSSSGTTLEYESLIAEGSTEFEVRKPKDERDPISVTYTSGTTASLPKGVVYSHRGAYLNSLVSIIVNHMTSCPVYLWCVPMFHCNGWCIPWAMAAQGGTNICLRNLTPKSIFDNIYQNRVTHMGGAPAVLNMIVNSPLDVRRPLESSVIVMTGGAAPPSHVLYKVEELGFRVTHAYGMSEAYGPGAICTINQQWESLPLEQQEKMRVRQGVKHICMDELDIKDPWTMKSVPADAKSVREVMFRGNTIMSGYFKNRKATENAFEGGWFRTGDLAVKHPDGYIEVKDRALDIIECRGEKISTIEIEGVIFKHPAVLEAAAVGRPDECCGQSPCAFVKLKGGKSATAEEIMRFCEDHLPDHDMVPKTVMFDDLPKTVTGKTKKHVLRKKAKDMGTLHHAGQ